MRKVVGRVALLLGLVLVAAAAWWGATTLFEDDARDDDAAEQPACTPASRQDAKEARSAFARQYSEKRWVSSYGMRRAEGGDGWVLFVVTARAGPTDAPECLRDVPVSYASSGRSRAD